MFSVSASSRPNAPSQRQSAASNSAVYGISRASAFTNSTCTPSSSALFRAMFSSLSEMSTPTTFIPCRASSTEWRPGPQATSSTLCFGVSDRRFARNSTSWDVPRVNGSVR